MKLLKWFGISLLGIVALLLLVSLFLPSKVHVERSIVINTTADVPFQLINNLTQWKQWSPWHALDTNAIWQYSDDVEGTNAWYTWNSKNPDVGNGKLTITESKEFELIVTKLEFEDMTPSEAKYIFEENNATTKITWSLDSDMGMNPIGKFFGLLMDHYIGPDYEKGLTNLKTISESKPKQETILGFKLEMRKVEPNKFIYMNYKDVKMEEIGMKIGEGFMMLDAYAKQSGAQVNGYPFTIWYSPSMFNVALPVNNNTNTKGEIRYKSEAGFMAYVVSYLGAYEKSMPVYDAMENYIKDKGLKPAGPPQEVYITDPMTEKDTTKWLTEMVFPVVQP